MRYGHVRVYTLSILNLFIQIGEDQIDFNLFRTDVKKRLNQLATLDVKEIMQLSVKGIQ